ncbi:MAG: DUF3786 domain-containing protein [Eubacteriales bacterium]|nr:DUF3786 domain-containing protein [Eubacteriales bacterium]
MSVNYHAFQSRGVLFEECEAVSAQWRSAFAGYDPKRIAGILNLEADETCLWVPYFGETYRLRLKDGWLEKKAGDTWTEELYFNESMAVYHVLQYTKDHPAHAGVWVASSSIDGVVSRNPKAPDPLLAPFAKQWTGKAEELAKRCIRLGGKPLQKGDAAFQFQALPGVELQMIFWDADEDFAAQAQFLVDQRVTDFIHYETVGCMISDLMEKIDQVEKKGNKT